MSEQPLELPNALRDVISDDLRPVTPLARPARRTLWLAPMAIMLLFAAMLVFGLRRDAPDLGFVLTWAASGGEMLLGLLLAAAALREAVPGTTLSRRAIGALVGTAIIAVLGVTWMTWRASPTIVMPGFGISVWRICLAGTILSALPALAVAGWLAARAFPLRPRLAGALYGLAAGLMADAGWRLFCHFSEPVHVLAGHTLGIVLVAWAGAGLAAVWHRLSR